MSVLPGWTCEKYFIRVSCSEETIERKPARLLAALKSANVVTCAHLWSHVITGYGRCAETTNENIAKERVKIHTKCFSKRLSFFLDARCSCSPGRRTNSCNTSWIHYTMHTTSTGNGAKRQQTGCLMVQTGCLTLQTGGLMFRCFPYL